MKSKRLCAVMLSLALVMMFSLSSVTSLADYNADDLESVNSYDVADNEGEVIADYDNDNVDEAAVADTDADEVADYADTANTNNADNTNNSVNDVAVIDKETTFVGSVLYESEYDAELAEVVATEGIVTPGISRIRVWGPEFDGVILIWQGGVIGDSLFLVFYDDENNVIGQMNPVPAWMLSGVNTSVLGEQTLTVTFEGHTTTVPVNVVPPDEETQGCTCGSPDVVVFSFDPDWYMVLPVGFPLEKFSLVGWYFCFTCDISGGFVLATDDMVSGFDSSTPGDRTVIVDYKGVIVPLDIRFVAVTPDTFIEYFMLDVVYAYAALQGTGIEKIINGAILVLPEEGKTEWEWSRVWFPVTADMVTGFNSSQVGMQRVTVTFLGVSGMFDILVVNNPNYPPPCCDDYPDCDCDVEPCCDDYPDCDCDATPPCCDDYPDCLCGDTPPCCDDYPDCDCDDTPPCCDDYPDCDCDATPPCCDDYPNCDCGDTPPCCDDYPDCDCDDTPPCCDDYPDCDCNDTAPCCDDYPDCDCDDAYSHCPVPCCDDYPNCDCTETAITPPGGGGDNDAPSAPQTSDSRIPWETFCLLLSIGFGLVGISKKIAKNGRR